MIFVESEPAPHTMYFKDEGYGRIQGVRCKELTSWQKELLPVEGAVSESGAQVERKVWRIENDYLRRLILEQIRWMLFKASSVSSAGFSLLSPVLMDKRTLNEKQDLRKSIDLIAPCYSDFSESPGYITSFCTTTADEIGSLSAGHNNILRYRHI